MSPRPPFPRKVGGHDPPAPMGAPPLCLLLLFLCLKFFWAAMTASFLAHTV